MIKTTFSRDKELSIGNKSKNTNLLSHKKKFHTDNKPKVKISQPFEGTKKVISCYKKEKSLKSSKI